MIESFLVCGRTEEATMASPSDRDPRDDRNRSGKGARWGGGGIYLFIILLFILFWGFGGHWWGRPRNVVQTNPSPATTQTTPSTGGSVGTSSGAHALTPIGTILQNPDQYYGSPVTVNGFVTRVIDRRTFVLGEPSSSKVILVVSRGPISPPPNRNAENPLISNDSVRATGEVQKFNLDQFQHELGLDWGASPMNEWAGRPALVADAVSLISTAPGVPAR